VDHFSTVRNNNPNSHVLLSAEKGEEEEEEEEEEGVGKLFEPRSFERRDGGGVGEPCSV
jgi:hypothetical protein